MPGVRLATRRLRRHDLTEIDAMLAEPDLAPLFEGYDRWLRYQLDHGWGERLQLITVDDETAGLVTWYPWGDQYPAYQHPGVDVAVAAGFQGLGVGTWALREMCRQLFRDEGARRVVADPPSDPVEAAAVYRRVGFRPVGVMRHYTSRPDGTPVDHTLYDLLPDDLR